MAKGLTSDGTINVNSPFGVMLTHPPAVGVSPALLKRIPALSLKRNLTAVTCHHGASQRGLGDMSYHLHARQILHFLMIVKGHGEQPPSAVHNPRHR